MKVFIGSSKEAAETKRWLARTLEGLGHQPRPWDTPGMFVAGQYTYSRLLQICGEVDAAIFVFGEDDKLWYRGAEVRQPRDNVLLEYGMFSGILGLDRCIICSDGAARIGSDLQGLTVVDARPDVRHRAEADLEQWLSHVKSAGQGSGHTLTQLGLFRQSDHERFTSFLRQQVSVAKRIVMAGCGLAVLGHPPVVEEIIRRTTRKECEVEIYMANPRDPCVEARLIEEEHGSIRPPDGPVGLRGRLNMLLQAWQDAGNPTTFSIRLFCHYPTFALMIVDDEYFVYPYAYALLGNFSPVLQFSKAIPAHAEIVRFFDEHYERVKKDAIQPAMGFAPRILEPSAAKHLEVLAVYYIPEPESSCYAFGTRVLGYDVYRQEFLESKWTNYLGSAQEYGFHMTIADVLYFPNQGQAERAAKEVEFVASQFGSFELTDIKLSRRFPSPTSIAYSVRDRSGTLEALHCELVSRIYRRAVASEFTIRRAVLDRGGPRERNELIMARYQAPYVLQSYRPHLTLLANVPANAMGAVFAELARESAREVGQSSLLVNRLAIMARRPDGKWRVKKFVSLG